MAQARRTADDPARRLLSSLDSPFTAEPLFDHLADTVYFIKDARGRYVVVNQTLADRCGVADKAAIIGRTADALFPPPLGEQYAAQDRAVVRTGRAIEQRFELHLYPAGASGWCVTTKLPLRDRRGRVVGLVGISRDLVPHHAHPDTRDYDAIGQAFACIQARYAEPLVIADLAALVGLSAYQFDQRIRKLLGITVGQLIHKTRMDAATRMLRDTTRPIADVAAACGYGDQSAFTRSFKSTTGLSPARFRRAVSRLQE